ncbi:MAG TPA: hypothetical protein VFX50_03210, partial [Gemmatimonadales bacterium]|nr:hypothetical protein [Gemmatimonadales bacterium]
AAPAAAQTRAPGGADTIVADGPLSYPMTFDTMEVYLLSLVPPDSRGNVRNLELSGSGQQLRVDSEVKIGAIPGFELLAPLGWARLTATGPVRVLRRGVVVWEVRSMQLGGREVPQTVWENLLQVATKREDALVPFRVGAWVSRVEVERERMVLYRN